MISKHKILALGTISFLILAVLSANNPEIIERNIRGNILKVIARSRDLMQGNPRLFNECLDTYLASMNAASDTFKKSHATCCSDADNKRSAVESSCLLSRNKYANRTEASCATMAQCHNVSSINGMYECYKNRGNNNAQVSREIANDASFEMSDYIEKVRIINSNEDVCTNKTQEKYEYQTIEMYNIFDNCCKGIVKTTPSPVTTTTPSETTP